MDLKEFLNQQKDQLDDRDFNEDLVWNKIEVDLDRKSGFALNLLQWAASIALIIGIATMMFYLGYEKGQQQKVVAMDSNWNRVDAYYNKTYQALLSRFNQSAQFDADAKVAFIETLEVLEIEQKRLSERLAIDPENEIIQSALIENAKARIRALEQILQSNSKVKSEINEDQYLTL